MNRWRNDGRRLGRVGCLPAVVTSLPPRSGAAKAGAHVSTLSIVAPWASPPATATIFDGATGGDPDFFWLPRTVASAPLPLAPFDGTARNRLAVEDCRLDADEACIPGPLVARGAVDGVEDYRRAPAFALRLANAALPRALRSNSFAFAAARSAESRGGDILPGSSEFVV